MNKRLPSQGSISVIAVLSVLIFSAAGFGISRLMNSFKRQVEIQLAMDRCTGRGATGIRKTSTEISHLNSVIESLRGLIQISTIYPKAIPVIQRALAIAVGLQKGALILWQSQRWAWSAQAQCPKTKGVALPLPNHHWERPPSDAIGPRALIWKSANSPQFDFVMIHRRLLSRAVVRRKENWHAAWVKIGAGAH